MPLPQIHSHNFFFFYFSNAIATNQLTQFFFPSILAMPLPQFFFPCHNWFPFQALSLACILGTSRASLHFTKTGISIISLPIFNFFSLPITSLAFLLSHIFSYNFNNSVAKIQFLSSFYQITLNSTYNNNKLHFLQFLAKRLLFVSTIYIIHSEAFVANS